MSASDSAFLADIQAAIAADASGDTATAQAAIEAAHARYLQLNRGGTTPGGLPYPSPLDPAFELADAIRRLAEAIAGPYRIAQGAVTLTTTAVAAITATVTLPAGMFNITPQGYTNVRSGVGGTQKITSRAYGGTATTLAIGIWQGDGTSFAAGLSVPINWVAIQMTPTSAYS